MLQIPEEIKNTLGNIGLDRTEMQVYMMLLKKNLLTIQQLTDELSLPRSSVHLACENLLEKGVLKVSVTGKRRNFYIEHPKDIGHALEQEENKIKSNRLSLASILPRLVALSAISQEAEPIDIEELQGEDGFVEIFYRGLDQPKGGEILRFSGNPADFTVARDQLKGYREKRMKKKIYTRILQQRSELSESEIADAKFKMREVRVLKKELYDPKVHVSVWTDNTAFTVWDKGLHSIIIRNKAIAGFARQMFELAWASADKK